ncbi:pyridoxamine 5'-phosphate oxidase family protein [Pseudonocardia sp. TRM90224]|uniref:pyridoxamine 5'-phosphate oxidase family protein n=1 Tax=Pseudonocardia sp. TRM90224 TaxID=2812678 RepID=UPI001E30536D|nr:pyridoxamine 5'-phosphate oxidase family protein [Pseudonocardia sp. TRM90224]
MAMWKDVEDDEPEFAALVRRLFEANKHLTMATIRADGAPRISGTECSFADGELTFGSMSGARKGADLRRDPRLALHSATVDPPEGNNAGWQGDAKIAGTAVYAGDVDDQDGDLFRVDITEVVHTGLDEAATKLVVRTWKPRQGLRRIERS